MNINQKSFEINNEIINDKLNRIVDLDVKLNNFKEAYAQIKQNVVVKVSKNTILILLRLIVFVSFIIFLIAFVSSFFPEKYIYYLEKKSHNSVDFDLKQKIEQVFRIGTVISGIFLLLLYSINKLIKQNIKSRNTIYKLNFLLKDMIGYLSTTSEEEKQKYELFVDMMNISQDFHPDEKGNHI